MEAANPPQIHPQVTPQVLAGRTLRMMREAHHIGLREMAAKVAVSPSHLSRVESGERAAGTDLTHRLCAALSELPVPSEGRVS